MSGKKRFGQCIYCLKKKRVADDYVPPKSLFPRSGDRGLITIPSCRECKQYWSQEDEYFRAVVVSSLGGGAAVMDADIDRIELMAARIVRAIFFHETGTALPMNCFVLGLLVQEYNADPIQSEFFKTGPIRSIQDDAFRYTFQSEEPEISRVVAQFFQSLWLYGYTSPNYIDSNE